MKISLIVWWLSVAAFALTAAVYAWQGRLLTALSGVIVSVAVVVHRFALKKLPVARKIGGFGVCVAGWLITGVFGFAFGIGAGLLTVVLGWKPVVKVYAAWRRRKRIDDSVMVVTDTVNPEIKAEPVKESSVVVEMPIDVPKLLTPSPAVQPPKYAFKTVTVNS